MWEPESRRKIGSRTVEKLHGVPKTGPCSSRLEGVIVIISMTRFLTITSPILSVLALGASSCTANLEHLAETRAVAYLAHEVPRWPRENGCYSCHNNGDAARALYTAMRLGHAIPEESLADTASWLSTPGTWHKNKGNPAFNDAVLTRIQFAGALLEARRSGAIRDAGALRQAADLVASCQGRDGSWQVGKAALIGSPITYGSHLATYMAVRVLEESGREELAPAIRKARLWLERAPVRNVLEAATALLALEGEREHSGSSTSTSTGRQCLEIIREGQSRHGGWGPFVNAAPEPFDPAVVLLALRTLPATEDIDALIRRGRRYLVENQQVDGSWLETTRPADAESYAQRISTTSWAALALLQSR